MKFLANVCGVDIYADTEDKEQLDFLNKFLEARLGYTPKTDLELDIEVAEFAAKARNS